MQQRDTSGKKMKGLVRDSVGKRDSYFFLVCIVVLSEQTRKDDRNLSSSNHIGQLGYL